MEGCIFNIQRFCVNDGPGIRTTVFLKGCPLSCVWCHNPESQSTRSEILFYESKCTHCGRCADLRVDHTDFICFNDAKKICGKAVDAEFVLSEVLKDRIFYDTSGGGMTLSGGEPLFQPDFAIELLKKAKEHGLHTAVETCGFTSAAIMRQATEWTDLFLFDYKETDPALHRKYTGQDNRRIMENLALLNELGKSVILRCPIIPGYNDTDTHFSGIAETADRLACVTHIEVEPYHALGVGKYGALGRREPSVEPPATAEVERWLDQLRMLTKKEVRKA